MTTLTIKTNANSPYLSFFKIVEETEKAIKIQNTEYSNKIGWIPKKAIKVSDDLPNFKTYTFENWFRKLDNGNAISKAFNLF